MRLSVSGEVSNTVRIAVGNPLPSRMQSPLPCREKLADRKNAKVLQCPDYQLKTTPARHSDMSIAVVLRVSSCQSETADHGLVIDDRTPAVAERSVRTDCRTSGPSELCTNVAALTHTPQPRGIVARTHDNLSVPRSTAASTLDAAFPMLIRANVCRGRDIAGLWKRQTTSLTSESVSPCRPHHNTCRMGTGSVKVSGQGTLRRRVPSENSGEFDASDYRRDGRVGRHVEAAPFVASLESCRKADLAFCRRHRLRLSHAFADDARISAASTVAH